MSRKGKNKRASLNDPTERKRGVVSYGDSYVKRGMETIGQERGGKGAVRYFPS